MKHWCFLINPCWSFFMLLKISLDPFFPPSSLKKNNMKKWKKSVCMCSGGWGQEWRNKKYKYYLSEGSFFFIVSSISLQTQHKTERWNGAQLTVLMCLYAHHTSRTCMLLGSFCRCTLNSPSSPRPPSWTGASIPWGTETKSFEALHNMVPK